MALAERPAPCLDNDAIYLIETITFPQQQHLRAGLPPPPPHARAADHRLPPAGSSLRRQGRHLPDDQIKAFWRENAGAASWQPTATAWRRRLRHQRVSSTQADLGCGASTAKIAAARRCAPWMSREAKRGSETAGTYLTFEIAAPTERTLELRTYAGQRGIDHTADSDNPVILSESRGNLEKNAVLTIDWHDEATFTDAGGSGEVDWRIQTAFAQCARVAIAH